MGDDTRVIGNTVHHSTNWGISLYGLRATISRNTVYSNGTGISGAVTSGSVVSRNLVYDNARGIAGGTRITENTVYGNSVYGILGTMVTRNVVYENWEGIVLGFATAKENRVYNNRETGIRLVHSTATGNTVYGNRVGILATGGWGGARPTPTVENNIIFDNRDVAVQIFDGAPALVQNNTIYQVGQDQHSLMADVERFRFHTGHGSDGGGL